MQWFRRAASHGLGCVWSACRKRCHQASHCHPAKWTYANIETQKASFKRMGFSYDWDRTVVACDPEYYRWGQWIFLQILEARFGRAPQLALCNWCPSCKTVLGKRAGNRRPNAGAAMVPLRSAILRSGTSRSPITPRSCWTILTSWKAGLSAVKQHAGQLDRSLRRRRDVDFVRR